MYFIGCVDEITKFCYSFQERRSRVTDEVLHRFMTPRPFLCRGVMSDTVFATLRKSAGSDEGGPIKGLNSKNQAKKREKMLRKEKKKSQKAAERGHRDGKKGRHWGSEIIIGDIPISFQITSSKALTKLHLL